MVFRYILYFFRWNNCYLTIFLSETEGEDGDVHTLWQFTYDGVATIRCVLAENVTPFCSPGLLPEGVMAIYREHFLLKWE